MSRTLTDSILELVEDTERSSEQLESLQRFLEQAIPAAQQQRDDFKVYAPNNPEFGPQLATDFEAGLSQLETCFREIQSCSEAQTGSPEWAQVAVKLRSAIAAVRTAQQKHQERIEDGPTTHLLLNRLLLHISALQEGGSPSPMTLALLDGLPKFESELRHFIDEFEEQAVRDSMVAGLSRLLEICRKVENAIRHSEVDRVSLAGWRDGIIQYSLDFDDALAKIREEQLHQGPTSIPLVNLALAAVDRHLAGNLPQQELLNTFDHCRRALTERLPPDATIALISAHRDLDDALREARDAAERGEVEQLDDASDRVFTCSEPFAVEASRVCSEEPQLDILHHGGLDRIPASPSQNRSLLAAILHFAEASLIDSASLGALEQAVQKLSLQIRIASARLKPGEADLRLAVNGLQNVEQAVQSFQSAPSHAELAKLELVVVEAERRMERLAPES